MPAKPDQDDHRKISQREECDSDSRFLARTISLLTHELREVREVLRNGFECIKSHSQLATKCDLKEMECRIMSVISDHLTKQQAFNTRQATAIDGLVGSVTGLTGDIQALNDKIEQLQNSPGGVTPEDQALINELETAGEALATKAEAAAAAIKALDDQTPPPVPPAPPA